MSAISLFKFGRFSHSVSGPEEYAITPVLAAWDGEHVVGLFDDTYWLYGGLARKRPVCSAFVEGLTLRNVRPGSVISIEGKQYKCSDGGDVELSFQYPGTYEITVTRWPYLDGRYTVENPPPV
ncbi:hypothetical protein [Alcaligenes faecalis]|uniref:hypothetical protein n=1 Tax=Alcaligenes faecalis TaxID=511 RepID=UPI001EF14D43|nr:hypothetical protein [Alcaligenes faecalis]ULH08586.1 hypothetical protein MF263_09090 [Alcaligenes faecalis]